MAIEISLVGGCIRVGRFYHSMEYILRANILFKIRPLDIVFPVVMAIVFLGVCPAPIVWGGYL